VTAQTPSAEALSIVRGLGLQLSGCCSDSCDGFGHDEEHDAVKDIALAIDAAVARERERAAEIAEGWLPTGIRIEVHPPITPERAVEITAIGIAAAIRKGGTP